MRTLPARLARPTLASALLFLVSCGGGEPTGPDTPLAPVAGSLTLVSGDAQAGTVGAALTVPLVVNVKSTSGAAMSGQAVTWSVASGEGSVSQSSTTSGADGNTSVTWTLGGTVGSQSVRASAASFSVTFTATAGPGPVSQVVVTPATSTLEALEATVTLKGEVKDGFGNTTEGTVTWSSSNTAVLTVDAQGVAKALANGTADVVATSGQLTGKATLTVAQKATQVTVTPENPTVAKENTTQLIASAKDANGFAVEGAAFAWTSSDVAVATVDSMGKVTGVAEGTASVVATSGAGADTVTVTVTAAAFKPTGDTEIGGTVNVAEVEIPAGVTVTLKDDAVINASGDVTIAGTLVGDCVGASLTAGGALSVTGSVNNAWSDSTVTQAPDITLSAGGPLTLTGATLRSAGAVRVKNSGTGAARLASRRDVARAAAPEDLACVFTLTTLVAGGGRAASYALGSGGPQGIDALAGSRVAVDCGGPLRLEGVVAEAQSGGYGGHATSVNQGPAVGGGGGAGGDIFVSAVGDVVFAAASGSPTILRMGSGGPGGDAIAEGDAPVATGGVGGRGGLPYVSATGRVIVQSAGALRLEWTLLGDGDQGGGGDGGEALSWSRDGADATDAQAARPGAPVRATGGRGGSTGIDGAPTRITADLWTGEVENPGFVVLTGGGAGKGGQARARSGKGGDGSENFPDGAAGGDAVAVGGEGGFLGLVNDLGTEVPVGSPGNGGEALFGERLAVLKFGSGGMGWADCRVGAFKNGGRGGNGGRATGGGGQGGGAAVGLPGEAGSASFHRFGNGGDGGDGLVKGDGGARSDVSGVASTIGEVAASLEDGADGTECTAQYEPVIVVQSDPNGHAPYIALGTVTTLTLTPAADGTVTLTGNGNWVTLSGTLSAEGELNLSGVGTVAGYAGVTVTLKGTVSLDENGRMRNFSGTLTMDALNLVLPGNGDGIRNPAVYSLMGVRIG